MHRGNSGFIGILKEPTTSSAYGINSLSIQQESQLAGVWPGAVTVPNAPTIGTATATGTTTATVAFTAPGNNGGATITSYTATSNPDGITGTLNQAGNGTITISGLRSGINYTFTVTATNSAGTSASSLSSNQITTYSVPVNTVAPLVTGSATFGSTLNTSTGTWTGNPASFTYAYFWRRQGTIISGANSSSYTITRTDIGDGTYISCEVRATNAGGTGYAFSNNIGPPITALVPGAPTIGTAQLTGSTTATVSFTAPASDGGSTIINYFAVSTPGNITGFISQAGSGTITVSGLSAGTNYTFVVYAQNGVGNSPNSGSSNQVTTPSSSVTANSISIFGGGGGGASGPRGGGGGAGQFVALTNQTFSVGTLYQFTVGNGGPSNGNGGPSTWNGTVAGQGRGGVNGITNSTGGRGGNNGDGTKTGGSGGTGNGGGGGGGGGWIGAGANGATSATNYGGAGGSGTTDSYTGLSFGGGGGGGSSVAGRQGAGGSGGGGAGGGGTNVSGSAATGLASGGGGASGGTSNNGGAGFRGGIYLRLASSANYQILTAGQGLVTSGSGTSIDLTNTSYINYYLKFV
jgi:hypothetical protein